jgi:hypothetical protein
VLAVLNAGTLYAVINAVQCNNTSPLYLPNPAIHQGAAHMWQRAPQVPVGRVPTRLDIQTHALPSLPALSLFSSLPECESTQSTYALASRIERKRRRDCARSCDHAAMPPDRVSSAIDSLVSHLVPRAAHEDDEAAQQRHDICFELAKTIIDRCPNANPPNSPKLTADFHPKTQLTRCIIRRQLCFRSYKAKAHPEQPRPGAALFEPLFQITCRTRPREEMGHSLPTLPAGRLP